MLYITHWSGSTQKSIWLMSAVLNRKSASRHGLHAIMRQGGDELMRNVRSETGCPASLLNRFWLFFSIFHLPGWQTETAAAPLQHERIMWSYPKTLLSFVISCSLEITDCEASYRWWHLWGSDINSLCSTQTSLNLTDEGNNSKAPCSSCKNSTDCLSSP